MLETKGKVDVILGLQWGDEGKGKQIDCLLPKYSGVARFQGGPNAGHTYMYEGVQIIGHAIPSGTLHSHVDLFVGNEVVVNPASFVKEIKDLLDKGINVTERLYISERAKLITYLHPFLDAAEEHRMGKKSVGSTMTGMGPAYRDFRGRQIQMIGDLLRPEFKSLSENFLNLQMCLLRMYASEFGYEIPFEKINEKRKEWQDALEEIKKLKIWDVSALIKKKLEAGENILAEGAQGIMLDVDFGDYPYVTSSNTLTANACLGLGFPHQSLGNIYAVMKAYTTKVGGGSFPSKIEDEEVEESFRVAGGEYGATTGRPRMCGWIDLVALKRSIYLGGINGIYINKVDICPVDKIKIVTGYLDKDGKIIDDFPLHLEDVCGTVAVEFPGWGKKADGITSEDELPCELLDYIDFIRKEIEPYGAKIMALGTGPDRGQSVDL